LITLLNTRPDDWVTAEPLFNERMGDPSNPADVERLRRQSPLFSFDKIAAPLMVMQGANDDRVKKAEGDRMVVALRDQGKKVDYLVAPDEGHGFARPENVLAATVAMERFLAKQIGGRCQEDVSAPIAERLRAITVDVDTVALHDEQVTHTP
jgi:dipeptidyl aminopeptidase/acylaminoacyl peptidase